MVDLRSQNDAYDFSPQSFHATSESRMLLDGHMFTVEECFTFSDHVQNIVIILPLL